MVRVEEIILLFSLEIVIIKSNFFIKFNSWKVTSIIYVSYNEGAN